MRIWIEVKKAEDIDIDEEFNECFCDFYGQTGHDDDNDEVNPATIPEWCPLEDR